MSTYTYVRYIHTTCCDHIVINIICTYTYIRCYVIGRRRGAQAQRVNVSAPGERALRRDARGMSGDFLYCFPSQNDITILFLLVVPI
jgi:hypothetical protein